MKFWVAQSALLMNLSLEESDTYFVKRDTVRVPTRVHVYQWDVIAEASGV
jgi:hypothetical protein